MKFLKPFLILLSFILVVVASLTIYVLFNCKSLILPQIEKNLGVKVEASSVRINLPVSLVIEDLAVNGTIKCHRLSVTPSLIGFLKGDVVFNAVVMENPFFKLTRTADGKIDFGMLLSQKSAAQAPSQKQVAAGPTKQEKLKRKNIYVEDIKIIDGRVDFTDNGTKSAEPYVGHLVGLNAHVSRVSILELGRMQFDANGRLADESDASVARMKSSGWVDFLAKDMDAKVYLTDVNLTAFKSYYMKFTKKELSSGIMSLTADSKSEKNDLKVNGHLELDRIAFKKEPVVETVPSTEQAQASAQDFGAIAFQSMMSGGGKVAFDFSIRTKLDHPRLEKFKLKGGFFQNPAGGTIQAPSEQTIQNFKEIGRQFKEAFKKRKKELQASDNM